ncbi:MAG: hypothetical protein AAFU74_01135 [Bacteroidota bacterium]
MELQRMEKTAVEECMKLLSSTMMMKDSKTEAWLYFQFEDLLNKALGTSINNSDVGEWHNDGKLMFERWHSAVGIIWKP